MATRNLGSLTVDLLLKMGGFKQGMDRAEREAARSTARLKASFGKVTRALGAIGVGVSFVGITRGLASAAAAAIEYGDEINKAAAKTGVGVEAFSELAYAAKQSDVEMAALGTAFKKMQQSISEAASGTKSAQEVFSALQIDFESLRKLKPEDQFQLIAEQISRIRDPADKTRAAVELFGRAGAELLPLFEEGAEGIRKAREEAQRFGATLTEDQAKALAEADDSIKRLGQAWDGLARSMTAVIALPLANFFNGVTKELNSQEPVLNRIGSLLLKHAKAMALSGGNPVIYGVQLVRQFSAGSTAVAPMGSSERTRAMSRSPAVIPIDFKLPEDIKKPSGRTGRSTAETEAARELERQAQAYEDIYSAGMRAIEGLRTPTEELLAADEERRYALEQLAATYPNLADEANAALERLRVEGLDPIEITARKIFPEKEQEELSVFFEEAARNAQNILADFLFDPFKDGIKGMIQSFGEMLQRMAAQAIAADIAGKIFGSAAGGTGAGLLGSFLSLFGGGGGSASINGLDMSLVGLAGGGYTGDGAKYQPAGVVHKGEFVTRSEVTKQPGAVSFLEAFNRTGMQALRTLPGFAAGGLVAPGFSVPNPKTQSTGAVSIVNNFNISAPTGTVSRQTQQQIAAAAARGMANANRRNN